MAPIWSSYVEKNRTSAIMFLVDSSSPEIVGAATIHLIEVLNHSIHRCNAALPVMIVFTKSDLKSARSLMEVQYLMRLDHILRQEMQMIEHVPFNVVTKQNLDTIHDWCMQFVSPNNVQVSSSEVEK